MKKQTLRAAAAVLAVLLTVGSMPVSVFANEENTPKEEVVYINLNANGDVKEINVVNIFELDESGEIIDYGEYDALRNMTTTDEIDYQNNTVSINANSGKLYYEGSLKNTSMPWIITLRYYMDDKEYSADEIAGMSGKLDIKMTIRRNSECDSSFFEGYALQASFVLDTDNATNIIADGATIANVGSDKQLTFTILPDTEKDIHISADVKSFEMDSIAINGVRLSLSIDTDDASLQEKIDEIIGAVSDLDNGAGELNDGAGELNSATEKLNTATEELHEGVGKLDSGADELADGLSTLTSKNTELTQAAWTAYEALCSAAESQLNESLTANGLDEITLTPTTYSEALSSLLKQMDADAVYNKAYNTALAKVTRQVNAQASTLYSSYIATQSEVIYSTYINPQADTLYAQVAAEAVISQLMEKGYSKEQAAAYAETNNGKTLIANAISAMTDEQKQKIVSSAAEALTEEQKNQILEGAVKVLTEEEKAQIRDAYIDQLMTSEDITAQINDAVRAVNQSAAEVTALKAQLDSYGTFYNGLVDYTNAVSTAAEGICTLSDGLSSLYENTGTLKNAVGDLHIAVGTLKDGTDELKSRTSEFVSETDGMDTQVSDEIDKLISGITGEDIEIVSFVSDQNTNVKSVQFVIQTEAICIDEAAAATIAETEQLTFWQKLLKLFGLY